MDESTFSLKNGTMVSGDRYTIESLIGAEASELHTRQLITAAIRYVR